MTLIRVKSKERYGQRVAATVARRAYYMSKYTASIAIITDLNTLCKQIGFIEYGIVLFQIINHAWMKFTLFSSGLKHTLV